MRCGGGGGRGGGGRHRAGESIRLRVSDRCACNSSGAASQQHALSERDLCEEKIDC